MEYLFEDVLEIKNGKNQKAVENPEGQYPIYGSGGLMGYADDYICEADTVIIGRKGNINNPIYVSEPFWNVDTAFGLLTNKEILLPRYLFYFCKKYDFEKLNKTVTIPSLTKSDLLKIKIKLPNIEEQQCVIDKLNKIESIIELRKHELKLLDDFTKARFVEMFGDLLINDKQWMRLKISQICIEIVDCINKTAPTVECETEYKMLRTSNVKNGEVDISEVRYVEQKIFDKWTRRSVPQNGEVLLTREAPMGQVGLLYGVKNDVFLGQRLVSYRCDSTKMNPLFLTYQMMSRYFQDQIEKIGKGSTVKHIPVPDCTEFEVFVPPILKQNQFADFVQQVNKSKATIQKALDEAQLLFDSLMQQYFG